MSEAAQPASFKIGTGSKPSQYPVTLSDRPVDEFGSGETSGTGKMKNPPRMVRAGGVEREAGRDINRRRALMITRAGQFQTKTNCRRAEFTSSLVQRIVFGGRHHASSWSPRRCAQRLGGRAGAACDFGLVSAETFSVCPTAARSIVTS